jgi:HK97 family phage prohead protease
MQVLHQVSTEVAEKAIELWRETSVQDLVSKTKAAAEESVGTFEVVVSTADQDRQGDVIDQNGWDISHYLNNPIVLWAHDYQNLPIGVCDSLEMKEGKLIARGRFAPEEANPFAQKVRRLYDLKMIRTVSVGFIPRDVKENKILKSELLEFSFVPVPANPFALSIMKQNNISAEEMITKGLVFKEQMEGDGTYAQVLVEELKSLITILQEVLPRLEAKEQQEPEKIPETEVDTTIDTEVRDKQILKSLTLALHTALSNLHYTYLNHN